MWSDRTVIRHRWARRVASGARVIYGEGTRQNDPVTSEEGVPVVGEGVHSKPTRPPRIAVNDCLAKTQVVAKAFPKPADTHLPLPGAGRVTQPVSPKGKLLSQAPVN